LIIRFESQPVVFENHPDAFIVARRTVCLDAQIWPVVFVGQTPAQCGGHYISGRMQEVTGWKPVQRWTQ
jgi:hypothetical protein